MAMRRFVFILTVIVSSGTASAQEDLIAVGESVFVKCQGCHLVGPETKFVKGRQLSTTCSAASPNRR
jgi:cytochrome c2